MWVQGVQMLSILNSGKSSARGMVVKTFACSDYPMDNTLQPPMPRESLIPLFQVDRATDTSAGTFGNGFACYTCHSQFSAHAQVFVKFDDQGRYQAGATGLQDMAAEQGRSTNGLFTSHFTGAAAASELTSMPIGCAS